MGKIELYWYSMKEGKEEESEKPRDSSWLQLAVWSVAFYQKRCSHCSVVVGELSCCLMINLRTLLKHVEQVFVISDFISV